MSAPGLAPTPPIHPTITGLGADSALFGMLLTYHHGEENLLAHIDTDEGTVLLCDRYGGELQHQECVHIKRCEYAAACVVVARFAGFRTHVLDWEHTE